MAHDRMYLECVVCGDNVCLAKQWNEFETWYVHHGSIAFKGHEIDTFLRAHSKSCMLDAATNGDDLFKLVYENDPNFGKRDECRDTD